MKQIVCHEPGTFRRVEVPAPTRRPGCALVRIRRIGICGTDIHAFHGRQPYFTYPRVLGHELAGEILDIAPEDANAPHIQPGALVSVIPYLHCGECAACRAGRTNCCSRLQVLGVHTDGGMAEILSVPVTHLFPAAGLGPDQAAVIEPLAIGAHAVRRSEISSGQTALVIGAGPIGLGVMAFAKRRGARVVAMDISEERLEAARRFVAVDAVVNSGALAAEGAGDPISAVQARLAALTDGRMPEVVFDATGNAASMAQAVHYPGHGGKLVYVGLVNGDVALPDPEFHKRELTLLSSRNATREDFNTVYTAIRDGGVDVGRYVTHHIAFDDVPEAFLAVTRPEARAIKAVIEA
ncbi:zinc-binding alcohol dehydrogenase family protein [Alicyclobacillus sp.]|uniref:zinc-binding alcohol dehydrogenase family protein n=1 Tax=Alicyclobacillus sp. TaxID=61169 RepID=UPI0025C3F79E|nr:zinc-binding alcohol dehydrogenase family protein [Alicyclobacillus sp.]MCL6516316.1 zinc-binding alcohol dehydrogenase family protein [Alicyclobacillus sp.]